MWGGVRGSLWQKFFECGSYRLRNWCTKSESRWPFVYVYAPQECCSPKVGAWSEFGPCTATCGSGVRTRTRTVEQAKFTHNNKKCGIKTTEQEKCINKPCPVDCEMYDWGKWSNCTQPCGTGIKQRARAVKVDARGGGKACPDEFEQRKCNSDGCEPPKCNDRTSAWSAWTKCTATCGKGSKSRKRTVVAVKGCPALSSTETLQCASKRCSRDCSVGKWSEWQQCSKSCGTERTKLRTRQVIKPSLNDGKECPKLNDVSSCEDKCCPQNCKVASAWSSWTKCNTNCGGGKQTRTLDVLAMPSCGGMPCPPLSELRSCNSNPCPPPCSATLWSAWSKCSEACGWGQRMRSRQVSGGDAKTCGAALDLSPCFKEKCEKDCIVADWSAWSDCSDGSSSSSSSSSLSSNSSSNSSTACGYGRKKTRQRKILRAAENGGRPCPTTSESVACKDKCCAVNCEMSSWSGWGACSASCYLASSPSKRQRSRRVKRKPSCGGTACPIPEILDEKACEKFKPQCAPCRKLGEWSGWSSCSADCGIGESKRTRVVGECSAAFLRPATVEVQKCRAASECNTVDCKVSAWSDWDACSSKCATDEGSRSRTRTVTKFAMNGGKPCPVLTATESCRGVPKCDPRCKVHQWQEWSRCSKTCDVGSKQRIRVVEQPDGVTCPKTTQSKPCEVRPQAKCGVDCVATAWTAWSKKCSQSCGTGRVTRSRAIKIHAQRGGKPCGDLDQEKPCNTQPCTPPDCTPSPWGRSIGDGIRFERA